MKRFFRVVQVALLIGAAIAWALFIVAWLQDDLHVLSDYGLGSGPGRHTGYGVLAELVFLALPAGCFLLLAWILTLVLHFGYGESAVRRAAWTTVAIGAAAVLLLAFEQVLDTLGDRVRRKEEALEEQARHLAGDHDALAAWARAHDVNEPLATGGPTPLSAAINHDFRDLVSEFVDRGAIPTEADLTDGTRSGDIAMVRLLVAHGHSLRGSLALTDAFSTGATDMVALLAEAHMDVEGTLPRLIDPQNLALHPGEVDWQALRTRWRQGPTPASISDEIRARAPERDFPASEEEVLKVIDSALASRDLAVDPTLASLPLEPWMRKTDLCAGGKCPYSRQVNWAILRALYPEAIPALDRSKCVVMLRRLARQFLQSKADPEPMLRSAVDYGNVFLLRVLEDEGFDLRLLDGEFTASGFRALTGEEMMKNHLLEKGVRLRE